MEPLVLRELNSNILLQLLETKVRDKLIRRTLIPMLFSILNRERQIAISILNSLSFMDLDPMVKIKEGTLVLSLQEGLI